MEMDRVTFLAVAFATHAVVGYALVSGFTDVDPRVGALVALLPDVDFLFPAAWGPPFVHRGLTHTPAFALVVVVVAYSLHRRRSVALAAGMALGSHLLIDSLSPAGITWAVTMEALPSPGLSVHGPIATAVLWLAALGLLAWRGNGTFAER